jgi:hypothetical protein
VFGQMQHRPLTFTLDLECASRRVVKTLDGPVRHSDVVAALHAEPAVVGDDAVELALEVKDRLLHISAVGRQAHGLAFLKVLEADGLGHGRVEKTDTDGRRSLDQFDPVAACMEQALCLIVGTAAIDDEHRRFIEAR